MHGSPPTATIRLGGRVLVHSQDEHARQTLTNAITQQGFDVACAETWEQLQEFLSQGPDDSGPLGACIIDEPRSVSAVAELVQRAKQSEQPTQFILLPSAATRSEMHSARAMSCEVLDVPFTMEKLAGALFSAVGRSRLVAENLQLKRRLVGRSSAELIGQSRAMNRLRDDIQAAADHADPLLVVGPAGSGLSIAAQSIHQLQKGDQHPCVRINCAVLSGSAIERELFGSTSSSSSDVSSRLEMAAGGTLVLEHVDALPANVQSKLLRCMIAGRFQTAGSDGPQPLEARIIATTQADIAQMAAEGNFHAELARKLCEQTFTTPSLCDHLDDIGLLAEHFLAQYALREDQPVKQLTADALDLLQTHEWPGNVRELQNVIERCCSLETGGYLTDDVVRPWLSSNDEDADVAVSLTLKEMERKLIEATFNKFNGNREQTAKALQIGLRTLSGKLREYGYPPRGGPGSNKKAQQQSFAVKAA